MNRQEVYEKCVRVLEKHNGYSRSEVMLPKEAVDAIIDCAVQEAVGTIHAVRGRFVKNDSGINRHCTVCGAYMKDEEYENHTVRYCYYCGMKVEAQE